jgi:hypothetical protein
MGFGFVEGWPPGEGIGENERTVGPRDKGFSLSLARFHFPKRPPQRWKTSVTSTAGEASLFALELTHKESLSRVGYDTKDDREIVTE